MKDAIFLGFNFQEFADLNSFLSGLLFLFSLIFLVTYLYSKNIKNLFLSYIKYQHVIYSMIFILVCGVVGANIYELVYGDLPCVMCWYQRVLIYPMLILAIAELFFKTYKAYLFIAVLAALNLFLAGYHYYYHFQRYVMENILSLPCSGGLLPACTEAGVISFGFVTMPLMSVSMSAVILILCYFASKVSITALRKNVHH
jgi:disulfide bond formation protein DsbB